MGKNVPRTWMQKGFMGNQIHMYCDICNKEYVAKVGGIGSALTGVAGSVLGSALGGSARRAARSIGRSVLSRDAMNAVKQTLNQCSECGLWSCPADWNSSENKCKRCTGELEKATDSKGANAELAGASKMAGEAMAKSAQVWAQSMEQMAKTSANMGPIECPNCGKNTAPGKFCSECGKPLARTCPKCNSPVPVGTKHCSNCGAKLT
ncbi:MAG: double zinc ribbon domain-containing protein [Candidatus Ranarchaeia archaeon]